MQRFEKLFEIDYGIDIIQYINRKEGTALKATCKTLQKSIDIHKKLIESRKYFYKKTDHYPYRTDCHLELHGKSLQEVYDSLKRHHELNPDHQTCLALNFCDEISTYLISNKHMKGSDIKQIKNFIK